MPTLGVQTAEANPDNVEDPYHVADQDHVENPDRVEDPALNGRATGANPPEGGWDLLIAHLLSTEGSPFRGRFSSCPAVQGRVLLPDDHLFAFPAPTAVEWTSRKTNFGAA